MGKLNTDTGLDLEIHGFGRYHSNWIAEITVNGKRFQALRQGVIHIWAFPLRNKLTRDQQDLLDRHCEAALEAFQNEKIHSNGFQS